MFMTIALIILISLLGLILGLIPTKDDWRVEVRKSVAKGVKPDDYGRPWNSSSASRPPLTAMSI